MTPTSRFAEVLNYLIEHEPDALRWLMTARCGISEQTAGSDYVVVGPATEANGYTYQLRLLGILNGILAPTGEVVVAEVDATGLPTQFIINTISAYKHGA